MKDRLSQDLNLLQWGLQQVVSFVFLKLSQLELELFLLPFYVSFPFSFQFFTRLAAVFAEEGGGFGLFIFDGPI